MLKNLLFSSPGLPGSKMSPSRESMNIFVGNRYRTGVQKCLLYTQRKPKLHPWEQNVFLFLYFTFFTLLFDYITPWDLEIKNQLVSFAQQIGAVAAILEQLHRKQILQAIRPTVGGHQPISSLSRRDVVVVNRLRIGHTRCTHSYLLTGADQPDSTTCQCPLTVTAKHILAVVELQHNLWGGPKIWRAIANLRKFFEAPDAPPEVTFRRIKIFFYCNFSTKSTCKLQ